MNRIFFSRSILSTIAASLLFYLPTVSAQEEEDEFDRFSISLGVFLTDRESKTRLNGDTGDDGSNVDLESDLGLDRSDNVFRIDGYFRFNEKHRIDFSAFDLSRSKTREIDEEIMWGDTVYPINTSINTQFDLDIYKLAYTWSFMRREKGYLGVSAGLYVASFGARLSSPDIGAVESDNLTAPLPVVGLRGQYALSEKFSLRASGEIFSMSFDDYDGTLVDLYAGIDYQLFEHTAVGLGVNRVTLDIDVTKNRFRGTLDWQYEGGLLFLKFDF